MPAFELSLQASKRTPPGAKVLPAVFVRLLVRARRIAAPAVLLIAQLVEAHITFEAGVTEVVKRLIGRVISREVITITGISGRPRGSVARVVIIKRGIRRRA
jgi:hypothetical protein